MSLIEDLTTMSPEVAIGRLTATRKMIRPWVELEKEYDPKWHPVMDKALYPDKVDDEGVEHVTRIPLDFQRLAVKRMSELVCGIPIKRVYKPANDDEKLVADYMEAIYERVRIDALNIERTKSLFASCETMTLWYAVLQPEKHNMYGFPTEIKLRVRHFSPMDGDELFPLFDEYGDMVALSVRYQRTNAEGKKVTIYDTFTDRQHLRWSSESGNSALNLVEEISIGKIPAVYAYRPSPIWEDTSSVVSEMEWSLSRNGNYLRRNSKPLFVVAAEDGMIAYGNERSPIREFKSIMQIPVGASANYVTWQQSIEALRYHVDTLRSFFFTTLQLPDWSYEKMSQQALSGESRKQMFIDAQLKVKDESGRLLEMFDRETNILRAFLKKMLPESLHVAIDSLRVETIITPFAISDEADTINQLVTANGGKPIISQRESIQLYGHSSDVDRTLAEIAEEGKVDAFDLTE